MTDTENDVRLDEMEQVQRDAAIPKPALTRMSHRMASTSLGQFAIVRLHRILETVEYTAKWSCPITPQLAADAGGDADGDAVVATREQIQQLSRPLPWVFFLPALVVLRMVRFSVSTVSILLGREPVGSSDIVRWLQTQRRSLRALRFEGLQAIRDSKESTQPLSMLSTMFFMLRGICRRNDPYVEPEAKVDVICLESQKQGQTGKRRRSVDSDGSVDDIDENIIMALNRSYNENELDVTFELDAVSEDSQLSSEYESVSDSGCSEPASEEIGKKSKRRKRKSKKPKEESNATSSANIPQDLIGMSSGFESINDNPASESETDPTSSAQHTEDELNTNPNEELPAQKDEIKEDFKAKEIFKKHQVSPIRESDTEFADTDEMELTPKKIVDDCDERMRTTDEQKVIAKIFNHQKEKNDLKPFQRHKSNRNKKSKVPNSKN